VTAGTRRQKTNAFGFPDKAPKASSVKAGVYVGRIAVWATESCNIKTVRGTVEDIHVRYCQPIQRGDGYTYATGAALPPQA
jgi:hypothetical protein